MELQLRRLARTGQRPPPAVAGWPWVWKDVAAGSSSPSLALRSLDSGWPPRRTWTKEPPLPLRQPRPSASPRNLSERPCKDQRELCSRDLQFSSCACASLSPAGETNGQRMIGVRQRHGVRYTEAYLPAHPAARLAAAHRQWGPGHLWPSVLQQGSSGAFARTSWRLGPKM